MGNIMGALFRNSKELLDNFGLGLVDVNSKIEELAQGMGKTYNSLTAVENRTLTVEAALFLMEKRLKDVAVAADSDAEALKRATAEAENLWIRIGQGLGSVSREFIDFFSEAFELLTS